MKKRKLKGIAYALLVVVLILSVGVVKLYNEVIPMAETIQFPNREEIYAVKIFKNDLNIKYTDDETIKVIAACFLNAKATRNISVNDGPTVKEYYRVNIIEESSNNVYTSYIYQKDSKWFIEQPYWGIYEIDKDELTFLEYLH